MQLIYLQKTDWTLVFDITQMLKEKICFLKIRAQSLRVPDASLLSSKTSSCSNHC